MMCASRFVELHEISKLCRPIVPSVFMDFHRKYHKSKQSEVFIGKYDLKLLSNDSPTVSSGALRQRFDYYSCTNSFCPWLSLLYGLSQCFLTQEIACLSGELWVRVLLINHGSNGDHGVTLCYIKIALLPSICCYTNCDFSANCATFDLKSP